MQIDLYAKTEEYLKECIESKNDFKKTLEAEVSYKTAYRAVQDKKLKILHHQIYVKEQREAFDEINEKIEL